MKKHLAAIFLIILLGSLTACGESTATSSGVSAAPAQSSQAASETNAPESQVSSPAPVKAVVSVDYAPDELAAAYTDGSSDYLVKVVFTANTDIREFRYLELGFKESQQNAEIQFKADNVLYEMDTLTPDKPFVVSMNEAYCRDISIKTRSSLDVKRRNGDFVGAFPIYGYLKSSESKNKLEPDPYASRVVRDIFRMRLEGSSASRIAAELNRLCVLSPLAYKKNNGLPYAKRGYADKENCKWSAMTVIRILQDETYTGTLVQGKQGTPHYKIKTVEQHPSSDWIRVPGAHG